MTNTSEPPLTPENLILLLRYRWESGQRLSKILLLKLYEAVAAKGSATSESVRERVAAAGGVSDSLVSAFRSVLTSTVGFSHTGLLGRTFQRVCACHSVVNNMGAEC